MTDKQIKPVIIHTMHDWGGGLERWVNDFRNNELRHRNLILRPTGTAPIHGKTLRLLGGCGELANWRSWRWSVPIHSSIVTSHEYRYALEEILSDFPGRLIISSFIGHSLDLLTTGLPTAIVFHDYYPFCPALNIYFEHLCHTCRYSRLQRCLHENPFARQFPLIEAAGWMALREAYVEKILAHDVHLIAPSESVRTNLSRLAPELKNAKWHVIPHGINSQPYLPVLPPSIDNRRIRILLLSRMTNQKGLPLLKEIAPKLKDTAEFEILGCGVENAETLARVDGLRILSTSFNNHDLPKWLQQRAPDCGLLLSLVPETHGYTLSELQAAHIPVIATRTGSYAERIVDGRNGILVDPQPAAIIAAIRKCAENPEPLAVIRENLAQINQRSVSEMVSDYHLALPSQQAYQFIPPTRFLRAQTIRDEAESLRNQAQVARHLASMTEKRSQQYITQAQVDLDNSRRAYRAMEAEKDKMLRELKRTQGDWRRAEDERERLEKQLKKTQNDWHWAENERLKLENLLSTQKSQRSTSLIKQLFIKLRQYIAQLTYKPKK